MKHMPNSTLVKCASSSCYHSTNQLFGSECPPKGTPYERINIVVDDRRGAMHCSNCGKYTIYRRSLEEVEREIEKYKSK